MGINTWNHVQKKNLERSIRAQTKDSELLSFCIPPKPWGYQEWTDPDAISSTVSIAWSSARKQKQQQKQDTSILLPIK